MQLWKMSKRNFDLKMENIYFFGDKEMPIVCVWGGEREGGGWSPRNSPDRREQLGRTNTLDQYELQQQYDKCYNMKKNSLVGKKDESII